MHTPLIPKTYHLYTIAVKTIQKTRSAIETILQQEPQFRYRRTKTEIFGAKKEKQALEIDGAAEKDGRIHFKELCLKTIEEEVFVIGEEFSIPDLTLEREQKICVLTDLIDGTDLLEMGIPLWCSAIVFFDPKVPEILGAVVGL